MIKELLEVLELAKIVYSNNFTNEANYCYFGANNVLWTSNLSSGIGDQEYLLDHTFEEELPFKNVGIPSREFYGILQSLSEDAAFTQKEDHLFIVDGNKKIQLPTVDYLDPPDIHFGGHEYIDIPCELLSNVEKALLQFTDKTDEAGSKVHFILEDGGTYVLSTDINSVHKQWLGEEIEEFSIALPVFPLIKHFAYIAVKEYLYLKSASGTNLYTRFYPAMDTGFIQGLMQDVELKKVESDYITIPQFSASELFKVFGVNTKKPDRVVSVEITPEKVVISTGNDITGFVSVDLESSDENPTVKFKIGTEKLLTLLQDYDKLVLAESVLFGYIEKDGDWDTIKYVMVEIEEE